VTQDTNKIISAKKLGLSPWPREDVPDHHRKMLSAAEHHANKQIDFLKQQAELIMKQAKEIDKRMQLAYTIASAKYGFIPVPFRAYYLYKKGNIYHLTLIAPDEWNSPYGKFIAEVRQIGDASWEEIPKEVPEEKQSEKA
jgi:hypothetical protein